MTSLILSLSFWIEPLNDVVILSVSGQSFGKSIPDKSVTRVKPVVLNINYSPGDIEIVFSTSSGVTGS